MALHELSSIATRAPNGWNKEKTKSKTQHLLIQLSDLQNLLYAEGKYSLLVVIQGMDGSGKDGLIRNVFGKMNPQGVAVQSFKVPTPEELSHDFLWRVHRHVPAKGMIQIFNRSHYEDVLVTRVHKWCDDATAKARMAAINDFERLLQDHNHTHILKLYLHVSPEEQKMRLTERMKDPAKMWKYNQNDLEEAKRWKEYMKYYGECMNCCNRPPWHIIPADQNWYKEYLVAQLLVTALKKLKMKFPGLKK